MIPNERTVIADSLWHATAGPAPDCPPLAGRAEADVAIIGGGVTGLSAALELAERGVRAVVLEAEGPGWGASGRNGGQLNPGLKHDPEAVIARFGAAVGGRMLDAAGGAPDHALALVRRHGIACDAVQPGWIQPAHDAASLATLTRRAAEWTARGVGMRLLGREETAALIGTPVYTGGLLDPRGGNLHPLTFTLGLGRAAQAAGAAVHGESPVTGMARQGTAHRLTTAGGSVTAAKVLVCTNGYTGPLAPPLGRTLVPVRSIQVATDPLPPDLAATILPGRHAVSDSRRLMVYYKRDGAGRLLMGGRGDYDDRVTTALFDGLRVRTREMFPALAGIPFRHAWGGFVAMTADHYPHLTPLGPGVLSATGYNGRGLALGTVMGRVLADWATGTPEAALDFPVTPPRPIPFHFLRKPAVRAAIQIFRLRDALGI